ncbi:MAG: response regulator, partial [Gammaproteobacteria bacterium]|nr:response regulator [Gammaproteobacteria bacterium]MDH3552623.1 response regulator [Gammaproteobacteria bacterium]
MSETGIDILLVEDDLRLADLTAQYFRQNGLSVAVESRGDLAITRFMAEQPRVVLLDLMLPGTDGLTICRELREIYDGPILIFTARDSDIDQVIGLEAGADDYVSKPVDPMVLLARTRALLRRVETEQHRHPDVGDMVLGGLRIS